MSAGPRQAVLIARHVFAQVAERLGQHFDVEANDQPVDWPREELIRRLQGKAGVFVAAQEPIDATLLDACPTLRVVSSMAATRASRLRPARSRSRSR